MLASTRAYETLSDVNLVVFVPFPLHTLAGLLLPSVSTWLNLFSFLFLDAIFGKKKSHSTARCSKNS